MLSMCSPEQGNFFNFNETWWTNKPVLSPCFRETVLIWFPCGIVLFLMLLESRKLVKESRLPCFPSTKLGTAKIVSMMLAVFVAVARVGKMIYNLSNGRTTYWNQVLSECLVLITLTHDYFMISSFLLLYSALVASFGLSFFALKTPFANEDRDSCPEKSCSFINKVLFAWFGEKFRLGWKKTLEMKDLWSVNKEESSLVAYAHLKKYLDPQFNCFIEHKTTRYRGIEDEVETALRPRSPSLLPVLIRAYGWKIFRSGFFKFVTDLITFMEPFILKYITNPQHSMTRRDVLKEICCMDSMLAGVLVLFRFFISFGSNLNEPVWHGFVFVAALLCVKILRPIFWEQYKYILFKLGMEVRASLTAAIYRKSLKLSGSGRKESTVGEIVNLMSVDATRLTEVSHFLHEIWSCPLQVILAMCLLFGILGPSAFAGAGVFVVMIPLNAVTTRFLHKFQEKRMNQQDDRIRLLSEILNGIKILKLYAWEPAFQLKIQRIREKELNYLKKTVYIRGVIEFFFGCSQLFACIASFTTYILMSKDHVLTPSIAFVSIFLFQKLHNPLRVLPMALTYCAMLAVSIQRLKKFFCTQELNKSDIDYDSFGEEAVHVNRATFSWDEDRPPTLNDMTFTAPHGSLIAVVGSVGSGKSSLLSALSGEMTKMEGSVSISGSVGLVTQEAWIQNMTLRQNVTFSQEFQEDEYWKIIYSCALKPDVDLLAHGDLTEIGERGINLSGGQKQRVSLARAVYQDSSIYFLDDPLSAVDVHVGRHIFENVIGPKGLLSRKTRILVTHGVGYLSQCDKIIVMKEGRISEQGSMTELLAKKGAFADFLEEYLEEAPDEEINELEEEELKQLLGSSPKTISALQKRLISESGSPPKAILDQPGTLSMAESANSKVIDDIATSIMASKPNKSIESKEILESSKTPVSLDRGRQIGEEEVQIGKIPWSVYMSYLRASGRIVFLYLSFLCLTKMCYYGSTIWLQVWSDKNDKAELNITAGISTGLGIGIYASFAGIQVLMTGVLAVSMVIGQVKASQTLHDNLLSNILHAPMSFFDTTPSGRIVNRCGKDMNGVDNDLPFHLNQVAHCFCSLAVALLVLVYATPWLIFPLIPIIIGYLFVLKFYVRTSRQLRRLASVSRSPLYSHFQETLQGASVIRAFRQQEKFQLENQRLVDEINRAEFSIDLANCWMSLRLNFLGSLISCSAAVLVVVTRGNALTPGMVGLALSNAFNIVGVLGMGAYFASNLECQIVAVERIREYTEKENEKEWRNPDSCFLHDSWPMEGTIQFQNYGLRYRPGLDLVLSDISCSVKPGEKIGVVGRTGAGKSSLTLALFRIVEAAEGSIKIDDRDIADLGLHDLREKLTIIPQDPVVFSGSLRMNLDPFDEYSDEELWSVLGISQLTDFVASLESGLNHEITEGGSNLSVGQRQLFCLSRALLRRSKILIMDEATAAVDLETDSFIQETIRKEFRHCTVITIAHRINTILDSDRILVLDAGKVVEFDSPRNLSEKDSSHFKQMVAEAGLHSS